MRDEIHLSNLSKLGKLRAETSNKQPNAVERSGPDETYPSSKLDKLRAETSNKQSNAVERSGQPADEQSTAVEQSGHPTDVAPSLGRSQMVEVLEDGSIGLKCEPILKKALGTTDDYFVQGFIRQLARSTPDGRIDEEELNFMLSFIIGINPRNQL